MLRASRSQEVYLKPCQKSFTEVIQYNTVYLLFQIIYSKAYLSNTLALKRLYCSTVEFHFYYSKKFVIINIKVRTRKILTNIKYL